MRDKSYAKQSSFSLNVIRPLNIQRLQEETQIDIRHHHRLHGVRGHIVKIHTERYTCHAGQSHYSGYLYQGRTPAHSYVSRHFQYHRQIEKYQQ